MRKNDDYTQGNPHETYNNEFRPQNQTGRPIPGSKEVKQKNHSRQVQTREG